MSMWSKFWSINQKIVFSLCAVTMVYQPSSAFAQGTYEEIEYVPEQSNSYNQRYLLGGAAVLGAAAGAITAACIKSGHHSHHGSRGARGPRGFAGTNGIIGSNGAVGPAGPAGTPGATGPTGATGPGGGNPFVADPDQTLTVQFVSSDNSASPGISITPFIIYPNGIVEEGVTSFGDNINPVSINPITTTSELVYGSYTVGLRINVASSIDRVVAELTPFVSASVNNSTYQLPIIVTNIQGTGFPPNEPGYIFASSYEYPNAPTPFVSVD